MRQATQRLEGTEGLNSDNSNNPADFSTGSPSKRQVRRKGAGPDDVGRALKSAYDEALREEVPDDFLDLLGKLS